MGESTERKPIGKIFSPEGKRRANLLELIDEPFVVVTRNIID